MKDRSWKRTQINRLTWKARTCNLPTRDQKVHQYRRLEDGVWKTITIRNKPDIIEQAIKRQSEKKIYKNNICPIAKKM